MVVEGISSAGSLSPCGWRLPSTRTRRLRWSRTACCSIRLGRLFSSAPRLPEPRDKSPIDAWLAAHPETAIVARDRGGGYGQAAGFTHQLRRLLIDDRAGCFPLGATGDERHDRGFGGMLHGA